MQTAQFPVLGNALVLETCWYMVDSFLTAAFIRGCYVY